MNLPYPDFVLAVYVYINIHQPIFINLRTLLDTDIGILVTLLVIISPDQGLGTIQDIWGYLCSGNQLEFLLKLIHLTFLDTVEHALLQFWTVHNLYLKPYLVTGYLLSQNPNIGKQSVLPQTLHGV